jgi:hypothetical protein
LDGNLFKNLIFRPGLFIASRAWIPLTRVVTRRANMSRTKIDEILQRIPKLPDSAVVPIQVAAEHDNVSVRTVRRRYPIVKLSPGRSGVRVEHLRNRGRSAA